MKAQMSFEAIIGVVAVLLILVSVASVIKVKENENLYIRDFLDNRRSCLQLANEISSVFVLGKNANSSIELLKSASIVNDVISVGDYICKACCGLTNGTSSNFTIKAGYINIKNALKGVEIKA